MTGMAVLLLVRPIVRHRDRFAQSDERGDGWSADGEHPDRGESFEVRTLALSLAITLARDARDSQTVRCVPSATMMWPGQGGVKLGGFKVPTQPVSGLLGSARNDVTTVWAHGD